MTYSAYRFDGTDGTDLTTTNSGAVLLAGQAAGLNTAKFSASDAVLGSTGIRFTTVSGGSTTGSLGRWSFAGGGSLQTSLSVDFTIPSSAPSADTVIIQIRSATAGVLTLSYRQIGTLQFKDAAATLTTIGTAANFPAGTKIRITMVLDAAANTWTVKAYSTSGTLLASGTSSTASMGTANYTLVAIGVVGAPITSVGFDNLQLNDGSTVEIAEVSANQIPTANAGPTVRMGVGDNAVLQGSGTDPDGTIASYAWTLTSTVGGGAATLSSSSVAQPTVTATAPGVLTYQLVVTDNSGAASPASTVNVYITAATVAPISVTANAGSWTVTGAADAPTALSDTSSTTYISSPDSPSSASTERVRLAPIATGTGFTLTVDHQLSSTATGTATVTLYEGSTVRKVWTLSPTAALQTTALTLSSAELAAIGSLNALDVEFAWNV